MKKLLILFLIIFSYANEKVNIQLNWKYQFEFAGFIMAKEKGFYKKAGFDVNLIELDKNTNVTNKVLNTPATYGVGESSLVTEIMQGKKLELLMPIYDKSPYVLIAINLPVKDLLDVIKYPIKVDEFSSKDVAILGMLSSVTDIKKLNLIQENYFDITKKGIFSIYTSNELYKIKKLKLPYKIFNPKDYGFNFYGNILFTSKKEFENHRDRALKIMNATKKGYIYAFNHIDETIKVIKPKYNTQNFSDDKLKYEAKTLKKMLSKNFLFDDEKIKQIVTLSNILFKLNFHRNIFDNIYSPYKLTEKEQQFINTHLLKCITTINWSPFNTIKNGKIAGIAIDYWKYIKKELKLKSKCIGVRNWLKVLNAIKTKTADLTLSTTNTPEREKYAVFTDSYASFPIAIVTRNNIGYIDDLKSLYEKKIAVGKGYTAEKILKKHYPNLEIIETKNTKEALKLVSENKAFAAVDILPVLSYNISKYNFANLKIAGKTPFNFDVKIMIRKDYKNLVPLINRVIKNLPESKKEEIYNKWINVNMQNGYSKKYINQLVFLGSLLLFLMGGWGIHAYFSIKKQKKLEKKLRELSEKDGLTKIYNRRKIDEILEEEIKIAKRYNEPLSLIFFDIDHFKKINDTYGHEIGDKVLVGLAKLIQENIRESDFFGRWGGEEFMIICPHTDLNSALLLAEKLRKIIENSYIGGIKVTCSFGVTQIAHNDTVETFTNRVDKLLYISKESGRNRITFG